MVINPSFPSPDTLDKFYISGRRMWPDLGELTNLKFDRSRVPDEVVQFMRSTSLNEYGVAHYVGSYLRSYHDDFKLRMWSAIWAAEEYVHYLVLRRMLEGLGEPLTPDDFKGLEQGDFVSSYSEYFDNILVSPNIDRRIVQLIFGVIQEYSAVIAYTAAAEKCNIPEMEALFKRIAKDETRHFRFNQVALESLSEQCTEEERALIWPQFRAIWGDLQMPQEHIPYFSENSIGTELYTGLWSGELRSRMILRMTQYFKKFRPEKKTVAAN
jgi:rubrerythrin